MAFSDVQFSGFWDAAQNKILNAPVGTPQSLTDGPTDAPLLYYVSVAGSTPLGTTTSWGVGDWALNYGSGWQKIGADGSGGGSGGVPPLVTLVARLTGGSKDQQLAKASAADFDFKWVSPAVGGGSFVFLDDYAVQGQSTWDAALTAAGAALPKGGNIYTRGHTSDYLFTNPVIPQSVVFVGPYEQMPFPGTNQLLNLNGLQMLRIKTGGTITLSPGAGIANCVIAPDGMTFPRPNSNGWTGKAITINGDQTLVRNCLVLGFDTAYYSDGRQRGVVENFFFDCNNGFYLKNIYDTTRMYGLHGWPFATIQAYAASSGSDPGGYDASINYRAGTGMHMLLDVDDLYVDSAIMVGFKTGYDFDGCLGAHFGRAWSECYGLPGTIGFRFGGFTDSTGRHDADNNYVADAQVWHCDAPILVANVDGSGNRVSLGNIRVVNSNYHGMSVTGGNVSFNILNVRGTKPGNYALNITGTQSFVEGIVVDEGGAPTTPSVAVPAPFTSEKLDLLKVRAPYKTAGTSMFGANPVIIPYTDLSGTTLPLPNTGNFFKVRNGGTITAVTGVHGSREITLLFVGATTVQFGVSGGNLAGPGTGFTSVAGAIAKFYYDAEYGTWRLMFYADTNKDALTGGGGTNPALNAWTAFNPNASNSNGGASLSGGGAYLQVGRTVFVRMNVSVNSVGSGGYINVVLPVAPAAGTRVVLNGAESAVTGKQVHARGQTDSATTLAVQYYDNTSVLQSSGAYFALYGVYDSAS